MSVSDQETLSCRSPGSCSTCSHSQQAGSFRSTITPTGDRLYAPPR
jgi:hypothetical protein